MHSNNDHNFVISPATCKIQTENNFFVLYLSIETNQKESLHCYTCYATTSWEDCDKNSTIAPCPEEDNEMCAEMKVDRSDENNKPMTEYVKYCTAAIYCSDKECEDLGFTCTIQCCSEDLCNTSFTYKSNKKNIILVIVMSCLQTVLH